MKIGATGMVTPPASAVTKTAQQHEAAGFDSAWWPDHLMAWHPQSLWTTEFTPLAHRQPNAHLFLDTVACMTAASVSTERIKIGSSVTDPIRRHPAMLAQEFLSIDHFSGGRCIFGIGTGEGENAIPYGLSIDKPASRLEEALEIVRLLWENEGNVSYDSQFWTHEDAVLGLGPVADGEYPPIWVAAHGPRMLKIAGRLADGWLPTVMAPEDYRSRLGQILQARSDAGVERPFEAGLWAYTCIGESKEDCLKLFEHPMYKVIALQLPAHVYERHGVAPPLGEGTYGFNDFIPSRFDREGILEVLDRVPVEVVAEAILHGSVDEVIAELKELEDAGCQHTVLWNVSFLTDAGRVGPSFEAVAEIQRQVQS
ncbi:MAG: LLM class flavin-dependent oxidoreductase [Microthrixaceae bacterium]